MPGQPDPRHVVFGTRVRWHVTRVRITCVLHVCVCACVGGVGGGGGTRCASMWEQRAGGYPAPAGHSPLLGLEVSGRVVSVNPAPTTGTGAGGIAYRSSAIGASVVSEGDLVCGLVNGGGYAEYCVVPVGQLMPLPPTLPLRDAAALPETFMTVWHNVHQRGALAPGETLLVHGGGSGIGTTAIQLAKAVGASVVATAGSDDKCAQCLALGADAAINHATQDFVEVLKARGGVDVVLDMVCGSYFDRNLRVLKDDGRWVGAPSGC